MAAPKPVVTILHGAWHYPNFYQNLISPLRAQGYTVLAPVNPTAGIDDSIVGKTSDDDVKHIHDILLPYLGAGKEAVIVAHSYGGLPGTACCVGQTVAERSARGLKGGIKAAVFLGVFSLEQLRGVSLSEAFGGKWPPHMIPEHDRILAGSECRSMLYPDLPPAEQEENLKHVVHQSRAAMEAPIRVVTQDLKIPKTYVLFTQDVGLPDFARSAATAREVMGEGRFLEVDGGHFAFLRDGPAKEVVKAIADAAEG